MEKGVLFLYKVLHHCHGVDYKYGKCVHNFYMNVKIKKIKEDIKCELNAYIRS